MSEAPVNLKGVTLFLVGMMGAGKSTTGRLLAEVLGYKFFDTDALICELSGQSVTEIFAQDGEKAFRQLESEVIAELSSYRRLVVATGGGIVLNPLNWSYLRHGLVVWLDVNVDTLWERLRTDQTRPLLQTSNPFKTLQDTLDSRRSLYAQADVRVDIPVNVPTDAVIERVFRAIQPVLRTASLRQNGTALES